MKTHDIIIAGAKPDGLGAALQASSLGLKAALIERRSRLSPLSRACPEGILFDEFYLPYRAWWTENFINYVKAPGGANMFELLTADELDEFFSFMPSEIVVSMEPKKAGQRLGTFFQKLMPEIQSKNPPFVQKIAAIQQRTTDEAWKEKQKTGFPVNEP